MSFPSYSLCENMFIEDEDWNDEDEEQVLSKTVVTNSQQATGSTNVKVKVHLVINDRLHDCS